jgi:cytochrome P450 family 12
VSYKYVQQAIENSKSRKEGVEPSALEKLLQRDPNPTRSVIMALDMLMAGIDSVTKYIYSRFFVAFFFFFDQTSHSLTNTMLLLSENPEKQEKLRQELKRIMPNPAAPITAEMLNEMKYLRACIKEGMR